MHSLELDEDATRDLQSLKKTLARFWRQGSDSAAQRTVFIETSFETDLNGHLVIDAVAVPENGCEEEEADAVDFDLELVF